MSDDDEEKDWLFDVLVTANDKSTRNDIKNCSWRL